MSTSFSFLTANSVFLIVARYTCPKPPSPICLHAANLHVPSCTSSNGQLIAEEKTGEESFGSSHGHYEHTQMRKWIKKLKGRKYDGSKEINAD